ncbi:protein of unknown function (plasmid) [Escherichia coli]|nr:protein of unknown function [Escherichia coli]
MCCVNHNGAGSGPEVALENLLQERLQQMERDMVRDLQKEKPGRRLIQEDKH